MDKATRAQDEDPRPPGSVIGRDVVVRGDIEGASDLHVQGRVLGGVSVHGLVLDTDAEISGPVTAEAVVISGHVSGAVEARAVDLTATGRIEGDVTYVSLQIEAGARLSGRLTVSDGTAAAKADEPAPRGAKARSDSADAGQELVRMAARLRRAAE